MNREERILELWERALGLSGFRREDALLADGASERRLGARNVLMLRLRAELFGRAWPLIATCPRCAADSEFLADAESLAEELMRSQQAPGARLLAVDDIRAISEYTDEQAAERALFERYFPELQGCSSLDAGEIARLARRLEEADPTAVVSFVLDCPACGHNWSAAIDVGDALWLEVERAAERSLTEVAALARTFGWSEGEVMSLSPTRRAAYLQVAEAS